MLRGTGPVISFVWEKFWGDVVISSEELLEWPPKDAIKIKLALPSGKDLRALLRTNSCVELCWISRLDYPLSSQSIKDKVINMLYQKKRLNHNFSDYLPEARCRNWLVAVGMNKRPFCSAYINK